MQFIIFSWQRTAFELRFNIWLPFALWKPPIGHGEKEQKSNNKYCNQMKNGNVRIKARQSGNSWEMIVICSGTFFSVRSMLILPFQAWTLTCFFISFSLFLITTTFFLPVSMYRVHLNLSIISNVFIIFEWFPYWLFYYLLLFVSEWPNFRLIL